MQLLQSGTQQPKTAEVVRVHCIDCAENVHLQSVVDLPHFLLHFLEVAGRVACLAVQQLLRLVCAVVHLIGVVEGVTREVDDSFVLSALDASVDTPIDLTEVRGGTEVGRG